jgi:hypothetical protein
MLRNDPSLRVDKESMEIKKLRARSAALTILTDNLRMQEVAC